MTSHQLLHEIGLFLLGGACCSMVQLYVPLAHPFKQIATAVIALGTLVWMANVAGIV